MEHDLWEKLEEIQEQLDRIEESLGIDNPDIEEVDMDNIEDDDSDDEEDEEQPKPKTQTVDSEEVGVEE